VIEMLSGYREVAGVTALVLIGLTLLSCSRTCTIKPEGNVYESIRFSFYRNHKPVELKIVEFVVQREDPAGRWSVVWELQGEEDLSAIKYAEQYHGLAIVVPPETLQPKTRYRALASELAWPSPKGHSAVAFSLDEDGNVVPGSL
jgi:hypothetical protein